MRGAIGLGAPERQGRYRRVANDIYRAVGGYVSGTLFIASVAGLTTYITLTALGVEFAIPLAVLMAFFDLIPMVGATIGGAVILVVTLFSDFPTDTIVWVIWSVIYQQVENTVIQPRIQARAVAVHPFVVLVSVLFGSTLFGVLGALLAIPVAAAIQIAIYEYNTFEHTPASQVPPPDEPPHPPPGAGGPKGPPDTDAPPVPA